MLQIEIEPVWRFHKEGSRQTVAVMLGVLNDIRTSGKLTSAADHAGLSYRHVWNLVEQWSDFFGVPLVETHRGKGTTLTAFGEKLVWAGQRMQARLGPQLENLAQELATEIKPFLHQRPSVIRVHASHGFAVSKLRELLDKEPGIGVDLRDERVERKALAPGRILEHLPEQRLEADRGLVPGNLDRALDRRVVADVHRLSAQYMCWPPLIDIVDPVMKPASSEARNETARAISSAWPRRPTGIRATIFSSTFSGTAATISVSM